jgi:hypothetical protein
LKDKERTDLIRLVNSQEEVIYGHGKVVGISNTPFRDLFPIPALALSSNSKLQQTQDTNNFKINKKNITRSIMLYLQ